MENVGFALLQKVQMGIIVLDQQYRIIFWNNWMQRWTGWQAAQVLGEPITKHYPKFSQGYYSTILTDVLKERKSRFCAGAIHKTLFSPAAHVRQNDIDFRQNVQFDSIIISGQVYILIQVIDITNQQQRVTRLKNLVKEVDPSSYHTETGLLMKNGLCEFASFMTSTPLLEKQIDQINYQQVFERLPIGFCYVRLITGPNNEFYDGIVYKTNPEIDKILRLDYGTIEGRKLSEFAALIPDVSLETLQLYWNIINHGQKVEVEKYLSSIDKWIEFLAYSPEPGYVAIIIQDITKSKQYEGARVELLRKSARMDRMCSIAMLVDNISHELSQPLQALNIHIDNLLYFRKLQESDFSQLTDDDLTFALEQINRIADKIKYLNNYVERIFIKDEKDFDILEIINQSLAAMDKNMDDIKVILSYSKVPVIFGDSRRFQEVITNIIRNAVEAMEVRDYGKEVHITINVVGENVIIKCRDNGIGFTQEAKQKAFQPFFTTKVYTKSMGLGLTIALTIIEAYGGGITIENNKQETGACVTIRIPINYKV